MDVAVTLVREWCDEDSSSQDRVIGSCVECGRAIEEGEEHYDLGGGKLCKEEPNGLTSCLYRHRMRNVGSG